MNQEENIKFELNKEESALARKFMKEHFEVCRLKGKYQGAIGVGFTFTISSTSIGAMITVSCTCGAEEFVSVDL